MGCIPILEPRSSYDSTRSISKHVSSFARIPNRYESWNDLQQALRTAGLESSELIFAIDVTKSNTWTGKLSFNGKSLHHPFPFVSHHVEHQQQHTYLPAVVSNPYTFVMNAISKPLAAFDDDQLIPAFYFGDSVTKDQRVASFLPNNQFARGIHEVIEAYTRTMPHLQFSGGTSFAPAIEAAMNIVQNTGRYHILVILTDGQVENMDREKRVIAQASHLPLSIIILGIGDGPFSNMDDLDDGDYGRQFDNLQFVDIRNVLGKDWCLITDSKDQFSLVEQDALDLATFILMEIPDQYQAIKQLRLLDHVNTHIRSTGEVSPDE